MNMQQEEATWLIVECSEPPTLSTLIKSYPALSEQPVVRNLELTSILEMLQRSFSRDCLIHRARARMGCFL